MREDEKSVGWSRSDYLIADLIDTVSLNTIATGNWEKGKAPKFKPYPRPGAAAKTEKPTLRSLFAAFSSGGVVQ